MTIVGNYSKTIYGGFDETKRFLMGFVRKGIPWVDSDENKKEWIRFTQLRRAFDILIGNASPNNGFKPVGTGANNDFTLKGGDGTTDGAGRMYVAGMDCFLLSDINYKNAGTTPDGYTIFARIASISMTTIPNDTINDTGANFIPGELVGATITPDVTQPTLTATVVSNTANTIVTNMNLVTLGVNLASNPRYRIELAPPSSGTRTDDIYINASVEEINPSEDPSILVNLGTPMAAQYWGGLRQIIYVRPGGGVVTLSYVDVDGLTHYLTKIGTIARTAGQNAINSGDVTDLRAVSASLTEFLPKAGGTMTGDLQLDLANIVCLTHTETIDGRLIHVDGAKLDTITWTGEGVAGLLPLISWPVEGQTLPTVTTQVVNVSEWMKGNSPGASQTQKGVFITPPYNRTVLQNALTLDDFLDGQTPTPNKVYGRITEATQVLTGTVNFTFGSTILTGSGTSWLTQLQVGDIIQGADSNWYTIATVGPSEGNATTVETYLGPNTSGVSGVNRQRWLLSLYSLIAGVETAFTPPSSLNVAWFYHEVFDEATRPVINPLYAIPSDQVAAEIGLATTAAPGIVQLAVPTTDVTAGHVVQANDTRLGATTVQYQGSPSGTALTAGQVTGLEGILNFIQGSGITFSIQEGGGKISITISNSAPGGGGLQLATSGTPANVQPTPALGNSGVAAPFNHVHMIDPVYAPQCDIKGVASSGTLKSTEPLGFNPRFSILLGILVTIASVGFGNASVQQSVSFSSGGVTQAASIGTSGSPANTWSISQFTSAGVEIGHTSGSDTFTGAILTFGDII